MDHIIQREVPVDRLYHISLAKDRIKCLVFLYLNGHWLDRLFTVFSESFYRDFCCIINEILLVHEIRKLLIREV